jgi:hypothetical protein
VRRSHHLGAYLSASQHLVKMRRLPRLRSLKPFPVVFDMFTTPLGWYISAGDEFGVKAVERYGGPFEGSHAPHTLELSVLWLQSSHLGYSIYTEIERYTC